MFITSTLNGSISQLPFWEKFCKPESHHPMARLHKDIDEVTAQQYLQEYDQFERTCYELRIQLNHIRLIKIQEGDSFSARRRLLGYQLSLPKNYKRVSAVSRRTITDNEKGWRGYHLLKALSLVMLSEMERQNPDYFGTFKPYFKSQHRQKKSGISHYLKIAQYKSRSSNQLSFLFSKVMPVWYQKNIDSMFLGFSDHQSMKNWKVDTAGLMAQVLKFGFKNTFKYYDQQQLSLRKVYWRNDSELKVRSLRQMFNGTRKQLQRDNKKLLVRIDTIKHTLIQLRLIDALLKPL